MSRLIKLSFLLILGILISCGSKEEKPSGKIQIGQKTKVETKKEAPVSNEVPASKRITLDNKGVGKIKSLTLDATIDNAMVERGAALFKTNCTACHKTDKRFIGPNPTGILERRSPEWVMNMIINPDKMLKEDPIAKALLKEYNNAIMLNQNLKEEDARNLAEYLRTL